jgi:allantoinase
VSGPFDRIIIGTVVTSDSVVPGGYVALRGETIAAIGAGVSPAAETVDYGENLILTGLVDGHMHTSSSTG